MSDRSPSLAVTGRFSPLRYPGGKGKLARFIAAVIRENGLSDGLYVEPYAGGAAVAWELLLSGVVRRVAVNDLSKPIYSFWNSVLNQTDELVALIQDTPVTVDIRNRQKAIFSRVDEVSELELGFATFFLNRTNRSGILNGGMIGGREQTGAWKLDARYNKKDLIERIERIARARRRISLTRLDAVQFLKTHAPDWGKKTLVYLDPPYFEKGRDLYYNFYKHDDHAGVAAAVHTLKDVSWIVSYDDAQPIHDLYDTASWLQYTIGYSARGRVRGREAMFASAGLMLPPVAGSMVELDRWMSGGEAPYRAPTCATIPSSERVQAFEAAGSTTEVCASSHPSTPQRNIR
nr:DNA adenine methylase [Brevundimonas naejangsanensis]